MWANVARPPELTFRMCYVLFECSGPRAERRTEKGVGLLMRIEKRVRALETRWIASPVTLHFADGSTRELRGPRNFLAGLFAAAYQGANRTALQAEQLELIRRAVYADEPGGGHMVELVQVMLAAAEAPFSPELAACEPLAVADITADPFPSGS
jgi:hypothetical protein